MDIHAKMRACLRIWMTDVDLWMAMQFEYGYEGSPNTCSRERRKLCESGDIEERPVVNKNGVKYKMFKVRRK